MRGPRDWFPVCRRCGRPVERLFVADGRGDPMIGKRYRVECHGAGEAGRVLVTPILALRLDRMNSRLPAAFGNA